MPPWLLMLSLPVGIGIPCLLLAISAIAEARILSPTALIASSVRARHGTPELAEVLVTREAARLLGSRRPR